MTARVPPEPFRPSGALSRRDVLLLLGSIAFLTVLAWAYLLYLAHDMSAMASSPGMAAMPHAWGWTDAAFAFLMWTVMMVGMMLPSAAPMILLVARAPGAASSHTALFGLGYVLVWTLFSALATALQGGLQAIHLLAPGGLSAPLLGGSVLIAIGLYQWSALKERCLEHCQSPLAFLLAHWRPGRAGALRGGLTHGAYCVGCCWMLMGLLFVGGVMNLLWAAGLAVLVLLEKVSPRGRWLARATGVAFTLWGVVMLGGGAP